jgi:tetratricopeptide (TPR) repeat protein
MYGRAIETDPRNHIPFANRALVLLKQERYSEAVEDCDQCLKIDPRFVKALLRR